MERRLAAIVATDVVGYSALMERDEAGTHERLKAGRVELFEPEIVRHHGRIFKLIGDGMLAEFSSVVDTPAPATVSRIAVLPFDNLSGDVSLGYLGDGIAEDIITMLSPFPDLAVIARNSSFVYRGKPEDVRRIGKELGVGYLLEGSVRKEAGKMRIVAQLIDTSDGKHVWAERFDESGPIRSTCRMR